MNGQLPFKNAFSFLPQIPIDLILFTEEKVQSRAVDKQKQTEHGKKKTKNSRTKKHRYQSVSTDAPISRRAAQKRKKQIAF